MNGAESHPAEGAGSGISNVDTLLAELAQLQARFDDALQAATSSEALEQVRLTYLVRKGELAQYFKRLGALDASERPRVGEKLNQLKDAFEKAFAEKSAMLAKPREEGDLVDLTLPGIRRRLGARHPLLQVLDEIKSIFVSMGFAIESGPEAELDYYNFEALNLPPDHPSRDMQDTFYLDLGSEAESKRYLLRTHTSPVQIRTMEKHQPPVRIIAPGRVFRRDAPDATHSPIFHQCEGLCVDVGISFADLKGTLQAFAYKLFGPDIKIRFRPGFFPFTEPSAEYDFTCTICRGRGCRTCKNTGWIEISGAGMVDPAVFGFVNYDSERYTGYAWGMGVDRLAMLKLGVEDIRMFFDNDVRFLRQF
ncbi:MAG: phenylalanine--tRNA ligase subunit alpha [candidate division KSB1 bacterium]|nr:phenylalanine--tRNA ligase subunit alpha [candidate division KSB1 bacterium]MDZ7302971.1 phenylalanine--tRNA ligase subunit alpha [candidate division KSB1 bacterium]MDZ7312247.1 phenylalanine--tRNA ligase subunit alpha [candidate division KSB1 bacterium]